MGNESDCALDTPGCARQVAYGGYVKSKVLIQCYATIDEGCQQLPTKYEAVQVTMQNQNKPSGPQGDGSGFYTCEQLCAMDKKKCDCGSDNGFLKQNNLFPKSGASTYAGCMRNKFANYLHCVGRRVSKCYRQKWIVSREVQNGGAQEFQGCTKEWDHPYNCAKGQTGNVAQVCQDMGYKTGCHMMI